MNRASGIGARMLPRGNPAETREASARRVQRDRECHWGKRQCDHGAKRWARVPLKQKAGGARTAETTGHTGPQVAAVRPGTNATSKP